MKSPVSVNACRRRRRSRSPLRSTVSANLSNTSPRLSTSIVISGAPACPAPAASMNGKPVTVERQVDRSAAAQAGRRPAACSVADRALMNSVSETCAVVGVVRVGRRAVVAGVRRVLQAEPTARRSGSRRRRGRCRRSRNSRWRRWRRRSRPSSVASSAASFMKKRSVSLTPMSWPPSSWPSRSAASVESTPAMPRPVAAPEPLTGLTMKVRAFAPPTTKVVSLQRQAGLGRVELDQHLAVVPVAPSIAALTLAMSAFGPTSVSVTRITSVCPRRDSGC